MYSPQSDNVTTAIVWMLFFSVIMVFDLFSHYHQVIAYYVDFDTSGLQPGSMCTAKIRRTIPDATVNTGM